MASNNDQKLIECTAIYRELIGTADNFARDGLRATPLRAAKAWQDLTSGYAADPAEVFTQFDSDGYSGLVIVKDIEFFSLCEHHLLPFYGTAAVGYIPSRKIVGLSKLARLVDIFAKRLQVQERMSDQIADAIMENLAPKGVGVFIEARHLCMAMRGVQKQDSTTVTSSLRGVILEEADARAEFMTLVTRHG